MCVYVRAFGYIYIYICVCVCVCACVCVCVCNWIHDIDYIIYILTKTVLLSNIDYI